MTSLLWSHHPSSKIRIIDDNQFNLNSNIYFHLLILNSLTTQVLDCLVNTNFEDEHGSCKLEMIFYLH